MCRSAKNTTTLVHGTVPTDCNDDDLRELLFSAFVLLPLPPPFLATQHKALLHAVSEGFHLVVTINVHVKRMVTSRGECKSGKSQSMGFDSVTSAQKSL